jgi:hypothetical protein
VELVLFHGGLEGGGPPGQFDGCGRGGGGGPPVKGTGGGGGGPIAPDSFTWALFECRSDKMLELSLSLSLELRRLSVSLEES